MIVFVLVTLTALLAVTALVIDIGNARQARRNRQNFADAIALSAAQELPSTGAAEAAAKNTLTANLPVAADPPVDPFAGCVDSNPLPVVSATTSCISFDAGDGSATMVRILTPDHEVATLFAGIIGFDAVTTNAVAIAEVQDRGEFGGILPFGLPSGTGDGQICLKETSQPHSTAPCDGPEEGNFSKVRIQIWTQGCPAAGAGPAFADNVANGSDHGLEAYVDTTLWDGPPCPVTQDVDRANSLGTFTGDESGQLTKGLLSDDPADFIRAEPGRLLRGTADFLATEDTFGATAADDTAIWTFVPSLAHGPDGVAGTSDDALAIPESCTAEAFQNLVGTNPDADSDQAINEYLPVPDPLPAGAVIPTPFEPPGWDPATTTADPYDPGATGFPGLLQLCFLEYEFGDFYSAHPSTPSAEWVLTRDPGPDGWLGTSDDAGLPASIPQRDPGCGGGAWIDAATSACTDPLFAADTDPGDGVIDILRAPRFGYVPRFFQSTLGPGNNCSDENPPPVDCQIKEFQAVYIDALIDTSPDSEWHPGPWDGPSSAVDVNMLTAISLHDNMLPGTLVTTPPCENDEPCQLGNVEQVIELIE